MSAIRTYSVRVEGFDSQLYSARSRSKARAAAWADFADAWDISFKEFLRVSTVRAVPNPPGIGERIIVAGLPATRVIGGGQYIAFMRDDSDIVLFSHPADVQPFDRPSAP